MMLIKSGRVLWGRLREAECKAKLSFLASLVRDAGAGRSTDGKNSPIVQHKHTRLQLSHKDTHLMFTLRPYRPVGRWAPLLSLGMYFVLGSKSNGKNGALMIINKYLKKELVDCWRFTSELDWTNSSFGSRASIICLFMLSVAPDESLWHHHDSIFTSSCKSGGKKSF